MKINDLLGEGWNRRDAYQRDYDSSVSGFGRKNSLAYQLDGGANDEYVNGDEDEVQAHRQYMARHHKPEPQPDEPHDVHIDGKKWKTFGSKRHAQNVARKLQGTGKYATIHKSIPESASAGATSSANIATVANPTVAKSKKKVKSVDALSQNSVSLFGGPMEGQSAIIKR
jgi:hypothetical protein